MYRWHAHSRAVVFQNLHRYQIDTRLFPYLIIYATLYPIPFTHPGGLCITPYFTLPYHWVSLVPFRSMPACYHHCISTRASCLLSAASHRYRSNRVAMYCATIVENHVSGDEPEIEQKVTYAQIVTGSQIGSAYGS